MVPVRFTAAVIRKFGDDQGGSLAALLAYNAFLAVFPLLLVLVTVLGIVLRDDASAQQAVLHSALVDFPIIGEQLRGDIHSLSGSGIGLAVGLVGALFGGRGLVVSAQNAFNTAWGVPYACRPSFLVKQLRGFGLLFIIAAAVTVTGGLSNISSVAGLRGPLVVIAATVVSAAVNGAFFVLGFRVTIAREVRTRSFAAAAVVSAVVWQILLSLGSYLIEHELKHREEVYGLFGIVLGLIAWLHVQALVTLLLVEADVVRSRRLWPRTFRARTPLTEGDRAAYETYAKVQQRRRDVHIDVSFSAPDVPGRADPSPDDQAPYSADSAAGCPRWPDHASAAADERSAP
jgi:membrane protein